MKNSILLTSLLLVGLLSLNFTIHSQLIKSNYPYMNYIDEGHTVRHAQNMYKADTRNPHWFQYGAAIMNSLNFLVYLESKFSGDSQQVHNLTKMYPLPYFSENFPAQNFEKEYSIIEPPQFLLAGRYLVLASFTVAMIFLYLIARYWLPPGLALLPVMITSSMPVLFNFQSYVHGDISIMACLLIVVYCCLKWSRGENYYYLLIAGVISGIAMGIKYSGLLLLGFPFLFVALSKNKLSTRFQRILPLPLLLILGYYLSNPGSLGSEFKILETFLWDADYYKHKKASLSYFSSLFDRGNVGWPVLVLAILGLISSFSEGEYKKNRVVTFILGLWALCYLLTFLKYNYQPIRNMFCLLPILALFASIGTTSLSKWIANMSRLNNFNRVHSLAFLSFLFASPLVALQLKECSNIYSNRLSLIDSRIETTNWLIKNINKNSEVVFFKSAAFSNNSLTRLLKAGIKVSIAKSFQELETIPSYVYLVVPANKSPNKEWNQFLKKLNQEKRNILTSFGKAKIDLYPNIFRPNNMKLNIHSPLSMAPVEKSVKVFPDDLGRAAQTPNLREEIS